MKCSLFGDVLRVAMSDMYYMKRNIWLMLATSLITPLLYLVAFGYGLGRGVVMEGVSYIAFVVPGVVSLTTLTSSFNSIANKLMVQKRFYESFDEMMLCPISKTSIILGKSVLGVIKGMLCGTILLVLGFFMSDDMQITALLIVTMFISCLVFSLLGVAAGMLMPDLPHMNMFTSFVILPMTFLCGTMFAVTALPELAQLIINVLPLTFTTSCIRSSALGWDFPWMSLLALMVWGLFFYILSMYALRHSN